MPPQAAPPPPPRLAILCRWLPTPFAPPDVENLRDGAQRLRRQDPELLHRERLLGAASEGGGDKATMPGGGERRQPWREAATIPMSDGAVRALLPSPPVGRQAQQRGRCRGARGRGAGGAAAGTGLRQRWWARGRETRPKGGDPNGCPIVAGHTEERRQLAA
jgi:hypothetical protein